MFAINHNMTTPFFREYGTRLHYSALYFIDGDGRVSLFYPHFATYEYEPRERKATALHQPLMAVDLDGDGCDEIFFRMRDDFGGKVIDWTMMSYWSPKQQRWGGIEFN